MERSKLENFILPYVDNENGKPYEAITEYIYVNQYKIDQDKESIARFYINTFDMSQSLAYIDTFTKSFGLTTLKDLDLLENIIAIGLASGILKDDFRVRFELFNNIGDNIKYLLRDEFYLKTLTSQKEYVSNLKENVLNYMYFSTDINTIRKYRPLIQINKTKEEIKNLLLFWFENYGELDIIPETRDLFKYLLDNRFEEMFNACTYIRLSNDTPDFIIKNMYTDRNLTFIDNINNYISSFDLERVNKFKEVKVVFIDELERVFNEMKKNK